MSNLYKINNVSKENAMLMFLSNLESNGIPITLFIARLRDMPMELSPVVSQHLDNAILWGGGKSNWLSTLAAVGESLGAKGDF